MTEKQEWCECGSYSDNIRFYENKGFDNPKFCTYCGKPLKPQQKEEMTEKSCKDCIHIEICDATSTLSSVASKCIFLKEEKPEVDWDGLENDISNRFDIQFSERYRLKEIINQYKKGEVR